MKTEYGCFLPKYTIYLEKITIWVQLLFFMYMCTILRNDKRQDLRID